MPQYYTSPPPLPRTLRPVAMNRRKSDQESEDSSMQMLEFVLLLFMLLCIAVSIYQKFSEVVQ